MASGRYTQLTLYRRLLLQARPYWTHIAGALLLNLATAPLNLYQVANASVYLNNWHLIFAYVVLMSIPMLAVFTFAQRRIISGITGGAVK